MRARHTFVATGLVALLAVAGVTAAIAADPAGDPPPRIAFLANGIVPADALAAGPIAGQLGAPVFTTQPDNLSTPASEGLDAHNPELVIVLGGPVAIQDGVLAQVSSVTGLPIQDPDSRPDSGIVRAAGEDRFETAQIVTQLLGDYDPAYLGVDLKADDADLLDGKDSSAFLGKNEKAADSEKLDGQDSTAFVKTSDSIDADTVGGQLVRVATVASDGTVDPAKSQGVSQANLVDIIGTSGYCFGGFDTEPIVAVATLQNFDDGEITTGTTGNTGSCPAGTQVRVTAYDSTGAVTARAFSLLIY